jgi:hypothetical protein
MISPMFRLRTLFSSAKTCRQWRADASVSLGAHVRTFLAWDLTGWDMALEHTWGNLDGFCAARQLVDVQRHAPRCPKPGLAVFFGFAHWHLEALGRNSKAWPKPTGWGVLISVVCALAFRELDQRVSAKQVVLGTCRHLGVRRLTCRIGTSGFEMAAAAIAFPLAMPPLALPSWPSILVCDKRAPRAQGKYLFIAMTAGIVLGLSQQMRGAHFMSHTLWTAWLCWTVGGISHHLYQMLRTVVISKS